MKRRQKTGWLAGAISAAVILAVTYFTFADLPFRDHFEIRAVLETTNQLRKGSPVRIAGLDVGKVERIETGPGGDTSLVTLRISDRDVPIRRDATLIVEPRLALEGNYYIDVRPGFPGSPKLRDGDTIPLAQTKGLVQLDQVLDVFTTDIRRSFKRSVSELARGLGGGGSAGMRQAARELDRALGSVTATAAALRGTRPGDLPRSLEATGRMTEQLGHDPATLADLVTNFDRTFAALAADDGALAASVHELRRTLDVAPDRLVRIDAALPELTRFSDRLRPALRVAPGTLRATRPAVVQTGELMRERELPGLVRELAPVTRTLPRLTGRLERIFPLLEHDMACISRKVVPAISRPIEDGPNTTGQPPWLELLHMGANLTSAAGGSDGNGTTARLGITESESILRTTIPGIGPVIGTGDAVGMSPTWLGSGVDPPSRPDANCLEQPTPNLNSRYGDAQKAFTPVENPKPNADARGRQQLLTALLGRDADGALDVLRALPSLEKLLPSSKQADKR